MLGALRRTARQRYTLRHILALVVPVAVLYGLTRSEDMLLGIAIVVPLSEVFTLVRETPEIDGRWANVGLGAVLTAVSLCWLTYGLATAASLGSLWPPALTTLAGGWLLLDARRDFVEGTRREPSKYDDMDSGEVMLVMNHARLVAEALEAGPKTVSELAEECDLTESRVREALELASGNDTVYRVDGGENDPSAADEAGDTVRYALDESKVGPLAFVRENGTRAVRRLARPFRF
ncbi:hypothetical protein [Haloarchaeobius sp. DFWS5]|uniref:hypothetical protein n=1 Tax=Haloarchaeobius sp. DFWS5 TaxID=3446114 RepID=UPI003EBE226E